MALKIENVKVTPFNGRRGKREYQDFLTALRDLKTGQSFLWPLSSNDRTAIAIVQFLLDRQYMTRKEGESFRIGRTA
jgi:hypothetical protein